jgi:hypothetical protein
MAWVHFVQDLRAIREVQGRVSALRRKLIQVVIIEGDIARAG